MIDLAAVAAGFVFRAIAGGVATGVRALRLVPHRRGRRLAVHRHRQAPRRAGRARLRLARSTAARSASTPTAFLGYVRAVASGVMITAYCLWAFENAAHTGDDTWFRLSIVPFVIAVLRYAFVVDQGGGGAPEEVVLSRPGAPGARRSSGWSRSCWASVAERNRPRPNAVELLTGWGRTAPTAATRRRAARPGDADVDGLAREPGAAGLIAAGSVAATATPRRTPGGTVLDATTPRRLPRRSTSSRASCASTPA